MVQKSRGKVLTYKVNLILITFEIVAMAVGLMVWEHREAK